MHTNIEPSPSTGMERLIGKLAKSLFRPAEPTAQFLGTLRKYAIPAQAPLLPIDSLLAEKSARAFALFSRLPSGGAEQKLAYVLLCLATRQPSVEEQLRLLLKKGALGFECPYFNAAELPRLRPLVGCHIYNVVQQIYQNGLRYSKLKIELLSPRSQTHKYFLEAAGSVLREYEHRVVGSEYDFLEFYSNMHPTYYKLSKISYLSDMLASRNHQQGACGDEKSAAAAFDELLQCDDIVYRVHNECTRSYLLAGSFHDPYGEYFVKAHALVAGLIPPIISRATAEKIVYIGKYMHFLKSIGEAPPLSQQEVDLVHSLDISRRSCLNKINAILRATNRRLHAEFIVKHRIAPLFDHIRLVFLFGRVDFIESLFASLKESRKTTRRNFLNILENSLQEAFPDSPFNAMIDVYAGREDVALLEGFSLYCKLEHPVTALLEEQFVLKLVYVFNFLWKLKKVEHLCVRIGDAKYVNFIYALMFYVFNEVVAEFKVDFAPGGDWEEDGAAFDLLKEAINRRLDRVIERLFINTQERRIECLLLHLEEALVKAGKGSGFDDQMARTAMREFYEHACASLEGTYLFNMGRFL